MKNTTTHIYGGQHSNIFSPDTPTAIITRTVTTSENPENFHPVPESKLTKAMQNIGKKIRSIVLL